MPGIGDWIKNGAQGIIQGITGGASDLIKDFKADPNKVIDHDARLQELASNATTKLAELAEQAEANINATMQAESKSEHWLQFSWRPLIGYAFCAILVNNYILLPYFGKLGIVSIPIPDNVWSAMLVILGASAAGRSLEKWQANKNDGTTQ